MQQVKINEPTAEEQHNPSLEEELEMQQKAREEKEETPQPEEEAPEDSVQEQQQEEETEERPEWLPEKFKTPEALAKAYSDLEKKQSEQANSSEESTSESTSETEAVSNVIQEASDSFYENGELSDKNFEDLEKAGIPREFVEAYVKGQEATMNAEIASITDSIGGQENYDAMVQWASANLPSEEIDSYDEVVATGGTNAAKLAVKGLYARYMSEGGGSSVNIAKGATSGTALQPFKSMSQVTDAMKTKQYQQDPAYRKEVEQRISISNL